jgi:aldehyde:ferredoxin oxidoreductase
MTYGWAGNILRVDLSKGKVSKQPLDKSLIRNFLGGRGINTKTLFDEVSAGIDPFDPENRLIFGTGPITGIPISASRWTVTAKSPLTGCHGDAHAGGHWAPELKFAGFDHIVIQGRTNKPVYLWIDDQKVELKSAEGLWGKNTWETQKTIREELGDPNIQIVCIGEAGENLVRFANVMHELKRAAGRTGMGAVMGSKNLKAVAVRGTGSIKIAKPKKLVRLIEEFDNKVLNHKIYPTLSELGTQFFTRTLRDFGRLPTKNYMVNTMDIEEISAETFVAKFAKRHLACCGCPVHCGKFFEVNEGPYAGIRGDAPEYGCIAANGSICCVSYLPALLKVNNLANQYGIDVISVGHTIGAAMEWYERKIITKDDTDGIELKWGNYEASIELIEKIAHRDGFGDILAEGALKAAKKLGKPEAEKYVLHILGLELHSDVRACKGFALHFPTSTRGADHLRGFPMATENFAAPKELLEAITDDENIARKIKDRNAYEWKEVSVSWEQNVCAVFDSLPLCMFMRQFFDFLPKHISELLYAATGINLSKEEVVRIGERIYNVERSFNVREGFSKKDDVLPERMLEPMKDGPAKGSFIDKAKWEEMRRRYYELRGWDQDTGAPTKKKLTELGLQDIAEKLK